MSDKPKYVTPEKALENLRGLRAFTARCETDPVAEDFMRHMVAGAAESAPASFIKVLGEAICEHQAEYIRQHAEGN
jgi:hypothetical protein